jgi:hypothetical protein
MARSGDQPGDLPVSRSPGHRWPAVCRHRHPRAVDPGRCQRPGSARRQWRDGDDRRRRRIHADPGDFPRDSLLQPWPHFGLADGIVITPSHNPPQSGGYKYNPTNGGPADTHITKWIEAKANELLANKLAGVKRISYEQALKASTTHRHDYLNTYVADLINVIDFDAIRDAKLRLGVDPLGGAGCATGRRLPSTTV